MKLTLHGHDDRYAVEQLLLSLFPENTPVEATSKAILAILRQDG